MLPYEEFVEQIAYYQLFPWGDDWLQAGLIAKEAHNSHPYLKHRLGIEKFMPKITKPAQTAEQQSKVLMAFLKGAEQSGQLSYSDGSQHQ